MRNCWPNILPRTSALLPRPAFPLLRGNRIAHSPGAQYAIRDGGAAFACQRRRGPIQGRLRMTHGEMTEHPVFEDRGQGVRRIEENLPRFIGTLDRKHGADLSPFLVAKIEPGLLLAASTRSAQLRQPSPSTDSAFSPLLPTTASGARIALALPDGAASTVPRSHRHPSAPPKSRTSVAPRTIFMRDTMPHSLNSAATNVGKLALSVRFDPLSKHAGRALERRAHRFANPLDARRGTE